MSHAAPLPARAPAPWFRGHVLARGVTLVPVDATFVLLEVDRVVWQVPVHDDVAVGVEVQAVLPERCGPR